MSDVGDVRDWIVLGGNFCGIAAAFALHRRGARVRIIDPAPKLGGFMSPLVHGDYQLDKGPQFFDNFDERDRRFLFEVLDDDRLLEDIGFAYASFGNGTLTEDFAIPDWRRLGESTAREAFFDLLDLRLDDGFTRRLAAAQSFAEFCALDGGRVLGPLEAALCRKFLQIDASEIAAETAGIVTFVGRKLLFDQQASLALKAAPQVDAFLAAQKKSLAAGVFNLYPRGRNLEAVRARMEERIPALGIAFDASTQMRALHRDGSGLRVETESGEAYGADRVLVACDLRLTEGPLLGTRSLDEATHTLPEIFHFFSVERDEIHPSYYIQDYDLSHRVTRVTNMANYMGSAGDDEGGIVCAEVPALKDDLHWQDPKAHIDAVWRELLEIGAVRTRYRDAWAQPVPVTYRVGRTGFRQRVTSALERIGERYGEGVVVPEPERLTRKQTLDALRAVAVLAD